MTVVGRVCAKIYSPEPRVPDEYFLPLFQGWIRQRALGGVLIDVANYTHVPESPGIVLVGHDITFSLDRSDGRFGLLAQRRRRVGGEAADCIAATLGALLSAADGLERDASDAGLHFARTRIRIEANDRLRSPNTDAGFAILGPVVAEAARRVFGDRAIMLERPATDRRDRLAVEVVLE